MKSPKPPDPYQTAAAQGAQNQSTAITQQLLNMVNQQGPYGSLNYNKTGTYEFTDPTTGEKTILPSFTAVTTLSPAQQGLLEQEQTFDRKFNDIALQQTDRMGAHLATPFDYNPGAHEEWAGGLYDKLNTDEVNRGREQLTQRLANQGVGIGSTAYDDAMRNYEYSAQKARNDFMLGSYGQGLNTALTMRNQPINEIGALMSGGQVQQPSFVNTPQVGVNGTDIAGLINSNYQTKANQYNSMLGGLAGLGGSVLGGWAQNGFALSDKRVKTDVKKVGKMDDGMGVYAYRYKGSPLMQLGVMAQEAQKTAPEAVAMTPSGLKAVNYSKLAERLAS